MNIQFNDTIIKFNNIPQESVFLKSLIEINNNTNIDLTYLSHLLSVNEKTFKPIVDYVNEGIIPTFTKDIIILADYLCLPSLLKKVKNIVPNEDIIGNKYDIYSICKNGYTEIFKLLVDSNINIYYIENNKLDGHNYDYLYHNYINDHNYDISLRTKTKYFDKLLNIACKYNHLELVKFILKKSEIRDYKTCFFYACNSGNIKIVNLIMQNCEYIGWNDGLQGACEGGHLNIVKLMIKKGAKNWNLGLTYACKGGHLEIAELMIQKGANDWISGLYGACSGGHLELIKLMISKEELENSHSTAGIVFFDTGIKHDNGVLENSFIIACLYGHTEIIDFLYEKIDFKKFNILEKVLQNLCTGGHLELLKKLYDKLLISEYDATGGIENACKNGNVEIVKFLFEKGAYFNSCAGYCGFYFACINGHTDIYNFFMEKEKENILHPTEYTNNDYYISNCIDRYEIFNKRIKDNTEIFKKYYMVKYLKEQFDINDNIIEIIMN